MERKKVDWSRLDQDAAEGMKPAVLAKMYGISVASIYSRRSLLKKHGRPVPSKPARAAKPAAHAGNGSLLEQARRELAAAEARATRLRTVVEMLEEA